jgi:hypothetical protein
MSVDTKKKKSVGFGFLNLRKDVLMSIDTKEGRSAKSTEVEVEVSILDVVFVSSDSSAFVYLEDNPSFVDLCDHLPADPDLSSDDMEDSDFDDFDLEPTMKRKKDLVGKVLVMSRIKFVVCTKKWNT